MPLASLLVGGLVVAAAALRLLHAGGPSFWWDEARSVHIALLPMPEFLDTLVRRETNMGLYFALLRLWLHLGHSEFVVRSLSVAASVATVPALYALGTRLFGARAGLVAALLLTLNTFHIRYAQEARGYSLVALLVTIASYAFAAGIQQPSRKRWAVYIAASVLAVYTHVFALLVVIAHGVSLAFLPRRDVPWRPVLASALVIGALLLPFGIASAGGDHPPLDWIPKPKIDAVPRVLGTLAGAAGIDGAPKTIGTQLPRRLLLIVYGALAAVALAAAVKAWTVRRASTEAWRYGFIVLWLGLPIFVAFGVSFVKPIFISYYLIVCLPALVLLVAIGASRIARPWLFAAVLVAVAALGAQEASSYFRYTTREDWRGVTRYILSRAQPGDAIMFYHPRGQDAFDIYRDRLATAHQPTPVVVPDDAHLPGDTRRVWLVLAHDDVLVRTPDGMVRPDVRGRALQASIARTHRLAGAVAFGEIRVFLFAGP